MINKHLSMARRANNDRGTGWLMTLLDSIIIYQPMLFAISGTKDILFLYAIKLLLRLYYGSRSLHRAGFIFDQAVLAMY